MSYIKPLNELEADLERCQSTLGHLEELVWNFKPKENQPKLRESLNEIKSNLEYQLMKIRKRDFEIAVVGREKAGKSSLLNAWIGFELLPSEEKRCTYTTVEIRSCGQMNEQRYTIQYFGKEEFEASQNEKGQMDFKDSLREEEKADVEKYRDEIDSYLDKGSKTVNFQQFEDVKDDLKSAISHPGHARAVKKICIWTPKLSEEENVVLYDVPGYDSPITLHKKQTKEKIASVDAVLYAKKFEAPSLVDCEIEILNIKDSNNPYINAVDKLIVALTNCDQAGSPQQYSRLIKEHEKVWREQNLETWKLIPVCSRAELKSDSPEAKRSQMLLKENNNGKTGFAELKQAVNKCVNDARTITANDQCTEIINKIKDFSANLFNSIKNVYNVNENTDIKDSLDEKEMQKINNEWWAQYWKHLDEEFQSYFITHIRPKVDADAPSYLNKQDLEFKQAYDKIVNTTLMQIEATRRNRQEKIYRSVIGDDGVQNPDQGNLKIRAELAQDAINSLDLVTDELNSILWKKINMIIEWIRKNLWQIPEIRKEMIGDDENIESRFLKKSFDALIQRLARPAVNLFLKNPREKTIRIRAMEEYQMELLILNKFILDGKICERGIIQFLANGKLGHFEIQVQKSNIIIENTKDKPKSDGEKQENSIMSDDKSESESDSDSQSESDDNDAKKKKNPQAKSTTAVLKTTLNNSNAADNLNYKPILSDDSQFSKLKFLPKPELFENIHKEIDEDIKEFLTCMQNSIFYGSGIQRFFNQELDKFRRKFTELEKDKGRWKYYFDYYITIKDPKVKIPSPKMADEIHERRTMVKNMKAISDYLKGFDQESKTNDD